MNSEIKTFYDCMTSADGGTMRSWPERMHITDQVLHPSYMYMLEVVFAEVWADRKIAIVEILGRNFDPEHIGPLVAETVERMAHQGRVAGQVGFYAQKAAEKHQESWPKPQTAEAMKASVQKTAEMRLAMDCMDVAPRIIWGEILRD